MLLKIQALLLMLVFFFACSKESTTTLRIDSSTDIDFMAEGGSASVSFYCSATWTVIVSSQWCAVSQTSGNKGNNTLTINCGPNKSKIQRECTITITAKDKYAIIHVSQKEKEPEPISSLIYGKWVLKKGTPTGFLAETKFSHIISFNESGNYEETCYSASENTNNGVNTFWKSSALTGNWKGGDNKIVLNDWDGKVIEDTLSIESLSTTELKLKFKNTSLVYCRETQQFNNLKTDLIGRWYSITTINNKGHYFLNADGTASVVFFEKVLSYYAMSGYEGTWWVENNSLVLHDNKSAGGYNHTNIIVFINDKYLGFSALVLEKH